MEWIFRSLTVAGVVVLSLLWGPLSLSDSHFEGDDEEFVPSRFGEGPFTPQNLKKDVFGGAPTGATRGIASERTLEADTETDGEPRKLVQYDPHEQTLTDRSPASSLIPDSGKGTQEVSLIASDLGYFPKTLILTRDIPVRLFVTSASRRNNLCLMVDAFHVAKQIRVEKIEEITFVPSSTGKFRIYCPVNGMEGNLIVRDLVGKVGN